MKRKLLLFILFSSVNIYSQTQKYQATHTSQEGGRYEIIQSEIKRSNTFKLDKFTGKVYQFVSTNNDWFTWQQVYRSYAESDTAIPEKINYQIFMGGIAAKDCFLLNINTGITWILVEDKKTGIYSFEVF
jgi:hypothetical protein